MVSENSRRARDTGHSQIVGHPRHAVDAVDNLARNVLQQAPRELERLGAHKVARRHSTQAGESAEEDESWSERGGTCMIM